MVDVRRLVERLGVVLPFVAPALLAGEVLLARRRSLALAASDAVVAGAAAVTLALAALARRWVIGRVDAGPRRAAADDVGDELLGSPDRQSLVLLAVGLVVAAGGWVAHLATRSDPGTDLDTHPDSA